MGATENRGTRPFFISEKQYLIIKPAPNVFDVFLSYNHKDIIRIMKASQKLSARFYGTFNYVRLEKEQIITEIELN